MQILAMLTMLIDHLGIVLFPEDEWMRIVGRLAMPLYTYALVIGYRRTRSLRRYMIRLAVIAALSQLPYHYALLGPDEIFEFNVVFTLLAALVVLRLTDAVLQAASVHMPLQDTPEHERRGRPSPGALRLFAAGCIAACGCALLEWLPFDYGSYLLLLALIYRHAAGAPAAALHFFLNVLFALLKLWVSQMFSLAATLLIIRMPHAFDALGRIRAPRWLWRSFYPAHLAVLAVIRHWPAG